MQKMAIDIHPSATVHPEAKIGDGTKIGAYSIVSAGVSIGKNCVIQENVLLRDTTTLGDGVQIFPFCIVGEIPQHLGYKDEPTYTIIEDGVILREFVTVHRGTKFGSGITKVEKNAYLMAYCHVGHDTRVGAGCILANNIQMAGHVDIGEGVQIGGSSAIAQHCRVGKFSFLGGCSAVRKDVPPYVSGKGGELEIQGINTVGLKRRGFGDDAIRRIKDIYKIFYMQKLTVSQAIEKTLAEVEASEERDTFLEFVKSSKQGINR